MPLSARILLVDSDAATEKLLTRQLRAAGYDAELQRVEKRKAFTTALESAPEVILVRHGLADVDVGRVIEAAHAQGEQIPVILLADELSEEAVTEYSRRGVTEIVVPPLHVRLGHSVERVLRERRLEQDKQKCEVALRATGERYRILSELSSSFAYAFGVNADGTLRPQWVAGGILRITGYTGEELLPQGWVRLIADEDAPVRAEHMKNLMAGRSHTMEARIVTKTGKIRWIRDQARPLSNRRAGRVLRIDGVVEDITDRRPAEELLRARAYQQAALAQIGQLALSGADLPALIEETITQVSNALDVPYVAVLEAQPDGQSLLVQAGIGWHEQVVGQATLAANAGSQAGHTWLTRESLLVQDLAADGRFRRDGLLQAHGIVSGMTVLIYGRDCPFGVLSAHTNRPRSFTDDDVHFLQAMANALATAIERKQTDDALQASEFRYRDLFENAHDIIYTHDLEGTFTSINAAAERITGYHMDEIGKLNILDVIAPGYRDMAEEIMNEQLAGGEGRTDEFEILTKDGRAIPVAVSIRVIRQAGQPVGIQGIARDVSDRKRARDRMNALMALGSLAAGTMPATEVLSQTEAAVADALPSDAVATFVRRKDELQLISAFGVPEQLHEGIGILGARVVASADLATGKPIVINEPEAYAWFASDPIRNLHLSSLAAAPMHVRGRWVGLLLVFTAAGGQPFSEGQLTFLRAVANQLAAVMQSDV